MLFILLLLLSFPLRSGELVSPVVNAKTRQVNLPSPPPIFGGAHSRWPSGFP